MCQRKLIYEVTTYPAKNPAGTDVIPVESSPRNTLMRHEATLQIPAKEPRKRPNRALSNFITFPMSNFRLFKKLKAKSAA